MQRVRQGDHRAYGEACICGTGPLADRFLGDRPPAGLGCCGIGFRPVCFAVAPASGR